MVIPARLTPLLQPLVIHAFMKYKRFLRERFQESVVLGSPGGEVMRMINLVVLAIRFVLQCNRWQKAFDATGCSGSTEHVSEYIRWQLQWPTLPLITSECPSAPASKQCWSRNRPFDEAVVFAAFPIEDPVPEALAALEDVDRSPVAVASEFHCSAAYSEDTIVCAGSPSPALSVAEAIAVGSTEDSGPFSVSFVATAPKHRLRKKKTMEFDSL